MALSLRVAAYQFVGSDSLVRNAEALHDGLAQAARARADLLVTQECALTGYAGVDRDSPCSLDRRALADATRTLAGAARRHRVALALGTTEFTDAGAHNAVRLIAANGRTLGRYAKRAPYGRDADHYAPAPAWSGVHTVRRVRVGLRVCFEFRFPEYFRELLLAGVRLAAMGFSMVGPDDAKRAVARAHLMSRAAENGIAIVAANNRNGVQNCPTCIVDPDGRVLAEAPPDRDALVVETLAFPPPTGLRRAIRRRALALARRSG